MAILALQTALPGLGVATTHLAHGSHVTLYSVLGRTSWIRSVAQNGGGRLFWTKPITPGLEWDIYKQDGLRQAARDESQPWQKG